MSRPGPGHRAGIVRRSTGWSARLVAAGLDRIRSGAPDGQPLQLAAHSAAARRNVRPESCAHRGHRRDRAARERCLRTRDAPRGGKAALAGCARGAVGDQAGSLGTRDRDGDRRAASRRRLRSSGL